MQNSGPAMTLHFAPLIDPLWLIALAVVAFIFALLSLSRLRRGWLMRVLVSAVFLLILANPSLLEEERIPATNVAFLVVDQSPSQDFEKRTARVETARAALTRQISGLEGIELREIIAPASSDANGLAHETRLFEALDSALSSVPPARRAGAVFLTDGQIHDVPTREDRFSQYGPVHVLLSGKKKEADRLIVITQAPAYGVVGQNVTVRYRIEDSGEDRPGAMADVTFTGHDGQEIHINVPVGEEQSFELPIEHPGQNVFSLSVAPGKDEITLANNSAALLVNGVRDRLKVLLVSGQPHAGGRTWRDLLTSDPGVDLVHFTILREPDKFDMTPNRELALIPFPFRELFEVKLYDFDLVIFDRYFQNNILPDYYYENIVRYVEQGGAFLEASGPSFAGDQSIYTTPLKKIIPGVPGGAVYEDAYRPAVTEPGLHHPVTAHLHWSNPDRPSDPYGWGRWLRQIEINPKRGDVLMRGTQDRPLLVLDRVKDGRVAQIASDHIWLWSRGFEGGGPHAELLRRVVHWLMKEPELDERALDVAVDGHTISIRKPDYMQSSETVALTQPDGEMQTIDLTADGAGYLSAQVDAEQLGVYAFEDTNGTRKYAIIGDLNPPELQDVRTTPEKLEPLVKASGGETIWLDDTPEPGVRVLSERRRYGGSDWIGLKQGQNFTVSGVRDIPLLPGWLSILCLLCVLAYGWWREGLRRK